MYEIEKSYPIPDACRTGARPKYPWRAMEIGDSFYVPRGDGSVRLLLARIRSLAATFGAKTDRSFRAVAIDNAGVRVWRIA